MDKTISDESKQYLDALKKRVVHMQLLIDGVSEFAKISRLNTKPCKINVRQFLENLISVTLLDNKFSISLKGSFPTIHSPITPLTQVFSNLINNAIAHHDRPEGNINITCYKLNDFYEFIVEDDGPGIPAIEKTKIFRMFYTLKASNETPSSGVGLSIVKELVEVFGGTVTVQSNGSRGTKFIFTWPDHIG